MGRSRDLFTADLFAPLAPAPATPGSVNFSREIAARMAEAIKKSPHDRIEIAARMSRLLGEDISVAILDAWTAPSKEEHIPNLNRAIAFDIATEAITYGLSLAEFHASKLGGRILWGKDTLLAELAKLDQLRGDIAAREKQIKQFLGKPTR